MLVSMKLMLKSSLEWEGVCTEYMVNGHFHLTHLLDWYLFPLLQKCIELVSFYQVSHPMETKLPHLASFLLVYYDLMEGPSAACSVNPQTEFYSDPGLKWLSPFGTTDPKRDHISSHPNNLSSGSYYWQGMARSKWTKVPKTMGSNAGVLRHTQGILEDSRATGGENCP